MVRVVMMLCRDEVVLEVGSFRPVTISWTFASIIEFSVSPLSPCVYHLTVFAQVQDEDRNGSQN